MADFLSEHRIFCTVLSNFPRYFAFRLIRRDAEHADAFDW